MQPVALSLLKLTNKVGGPTRILPSSVDNLDPKRLLFSIVCSFIFQVFQGHSLRTIVQIQGGPILNLYLRHDMIAAKPIYSSQLGGNDLGSST
jgi:hypothetical protein